jgi:hypothetical protein
MVLMGLGEAAAELHCSERWLADNLRAGRFPAKKIGRKWVVSDDDITAILEICSVRTTTVPTGMDFLGESQCSMTSTTRRRLRQNRHRP